MGETLAAVRGGRRLTGRYTPRAPPPLAATPTARATSATSPWSTETPQPRRCAGWTELRGREARDVP